MDFIVSPFTIEVLISRIHYYFDLIHVRSKTAKLKFEIDAEETLFEDGHHNVTELMKEVEALRKQNAALRQELVNKQESLKDTKKKEMDKELEVRYVKLILKIKAIFRKRVHQAFQTPIQMINKTVRNISKKNLDPNDLKKSLLLVMNALSQNDLYNPSVDKIVNLNINESWDTFQQGQAKEYVSSISFTFCL
jgi:hypothetical protein